MAMMLCSRTRYGVRAMFQLACHWGEGHVPLRIVAEEQELSLPYLEQIIGDLRRSGLVTSSRGCQGGYELGRAPEEVSVGEIIRILDGPIFVAACTDASPDFDECGRGEFCVSRLLWTKVRRQIEEAFDGVSLGDLCAAAKRRPDEVRRVLLRIQEDPFKSSPL